MNMLPLMLTLGAQEDCGNKISASLNFFAAKRTSPSSKESFPSLNMPLKLVTLNFFLLLRFSFSIFFEQEKIINIKPNIIVK